MKDPYTRRDLQLLHDTNKEIAKLLKARSDDEEEQSSGHKHKKKSKKNKKKKKKKAKKQSKPSASESESEEATGTHWGKALRKFQKKKKKQEKEQWVEKLRGREADTRELAAAVASVCQPLAPALPSDVKKAKEANKHKDNAGDDVGSKAKQLEQYSYNSVMGDPCKMTGNTVKASWGGWSEIRRGWKIGPRIWRS